MQLIGIFQRAPVVVLVDLDSTNCFIDSDFVIKTKLIVNGTQTLAVKITNGDMVQMEEH